MTVTFNPFNICNMNHGIYQINWKIFLFLSIKIASSGFFLVWSTKLEVVADKVDGLLY